ncbi:GntR family transcriptional regulator [Ralstonia syzygii]|uniref:Putative transcriptional regulator, HTH GntR family n=1 Tax=Ralstonia syzygii R24 TaxID=907261 RepID=G2ZYK2_9RALS|nr:GntR family transcriptional regulator [Ralstonia syzygii]CCA84232.1 putative transcriptional regulator, HTH GntR family [Ralstonia syzygii R24]
MSSILDPARLRTTTVAEAAADELRRRILSGELPEGTPLKQDALATEFGISRIPIREALVQLDGEGLVRIVPHKGAIVSELSTAEITELFELRALLEPLLLKKSAPKLTATDYAELDQILAEYSDELHAKQPGRYGELNARLHDVLLSKAAQPKTLAIIHSLLAQTDRYTRLQLSLSTENARRAEEEHGQLVTLCREGNVRLAAALLKRHIDQACEDLKAFIVSRRRL